MTFEPDAVVDPAALEEAVRRADFEPTGVRLWVRGAPRAAEFELADPELDSLGRILVVAATGQRFLLASTDGDPEGLDELDAGAVLVRGRAVAGEGTDAILVVEGVSVDGEE